MRVRKSQLEENNESVSKSSSSNGGNSETSSSVGSESDSDSSNSNNNDDDDIGNSRLFVPFRTVGLICSSRPYCLTVGGNSRSITVPMGCYFVHYNLDKLQPTLTSRAAKSSIDYIMADDSMQISVAIHSKANQLSLYRRIHVIDTLTLKTKSRRWNIRHVIQFGRQKQSSTGQNALLLALLLSRPSLRDDDDNTTVPIVGEDSDSDSDSDDDSDSDNDDDYNNGNCEIVLVLAHRNKLQVQKRITIDNFTASVCLHPPTYVNKIVVGHASEAKLALIQLQSQKTLYTYTLPKSGGISCLESSPSLDVIAVGTTSGKVHLLNLRKDVILFTIDSGKSRITSISFCTAAAADHSQNAYMSVSSMDGIVRLWELTKKDLIWEDILHPGGVCQAHFLPNEPVIVSSGIRSNSIQMHLVEGRNQVRLLRQRSGHTSPPTVLRPLQSNYDNTSVVDAAKCQLLTGGSLDATVRSVSTVRSVLDVEYSQGAGLAKRAKQLGIQVKDLKLPRLIDMAMGGKFYSSNDSNNNESKGDMVSIHANHAMAYVWSSQRKAQSGPVLRQPQWSISAVNSNPPPISAHASAVVISSCGNFAIVGTKGGTLYKYNIQSGETRGEYPTTGAMDVDDTKTTSGLGAGSISRTMKKLSKQFKVDSINTDEKNQKVKKVSKDQKYRHESTIVGVAVDALNQTVTSVDEDGIICFWFFLSHTPAHQPLQLLLNNANNGTKVTKVCHLRSSNFLAIGTDNGTIFVLDEYTIVRRFSNSGGNHYDDSTDAILDLAWSQDGRKVYGVNEKGVLQVWDVPTYTCVDSMKFAAGPPTSIALLADGEIMALSHKHYCGITLWSDMSYFKTVHLQSSCNHPPVLMKEGYDYDADTHHSNKFDKNSTTAAILAEEENVTKTINVVVPKEEGLITLSGLPTGHWKNLFHLELVKQRNKPTEAPVKPKSAPFFLQWHGDTTNSTTNNVEQQPPANESKEEEEWDAVWDDDNHNNGDQDKNNIETTKEDGTKRNISSLENEDVMMEVEHDNNNDIKKKKRKITYSRSHLATLLVECSRNDDDNYSKVTEYLSTMGPSAIDVEFSSLSHGPQDVESMEYLHLASKWFLQALSKNTNMEVLNAYLHRFLYIHGTFLTGITNTATMDADDDAANKDDETESHDVERTELLNTLQQLKAVQRQSSLKLRNKMQHTLCLLRHFSRMV